MSQPVAVKRQIITFQTFVGTYCVRSDERYTENISCEKLLEELRDIFHDEGFVKNGNEIEELERERACLEDKLTDKQIEYDRLKEEFDQLYSDFGELKALQQSR